MLWHCWACHMQSLMESWQPYKICVSTLYILLRDKKKKALANLTFLKVQHLVNCRAHMWTSSCWFQGFAFNYWTAFLRYVYKQVFLFSHYVSLAIPQELTGVDKSTRSCWWGPVAHAPVWLVWLMFFWLLTHLALHLLSAECFFFFFTILALLECFRNVPILTSRGDLPKCQSELIWMIFIAVPQGLQLLACCFFGCHILMGDNILTGVGRAWFWMSQVTCHQGLHSEV